MRTTWWQHPASLVPWALLLAAACSHGEPFAPPDTATTGPFTAGIPLRLTYGGGADPAWLGESQIIYSFTSRERSNRHSSTPDKCLGIIPSSGGNRVRTICNTSAFEADTLDVHSQPAPEPGTDRLAFLRGRLSVGVGAGVTNIVVGAIASAPDGAILQSAVFNSSDGFMFQSGLLRWLAPDTLIFLGADNGTLSPQCEACTATTVRRWRDAFRLPASGGAKAQLIPGTKFATSITAAAQPGQVYVTYAYDTRVQLLDLATGIATVVADFGAAGVPRDADFAAGRIALVAGRVDPSLLDDVGDPMQSVDGGGSLYLVDAVTGAITALPSPLAGFRHPRLSTDGHAIVVEGFGPASASSDLYRFDVP